MKGPTLTLTLTLPLPLPPGNILNHYYPMSMKGLPLPLIIPSPPGNILNHYHPMKGFALSMLPNISDTKWA